MNITTAHREKAYTLFLPIFKRENGEITKKRMKSILKNERSLQDLRTEISHESLVCLLRGLINDGILRSEMLARRQFPNLFTNSADPTHTSDRNGITVNDSTNTDNTASTGLRIRGVAAATQADSPMNRNILDLPPACLPYGTQHKILSKAQEFLEKACFDFATKSLPDVLVSHGYKCPEAVELVVWPKIFAANSGTLAYEFPNLSRERLDPLFASTRNLRNIAVHRLVIPATEVSQLVADAISLVEILHGRARADSLRVLNEKIIAEMGTIETKRSELKAGFYVKLEEIRKEREELDRKEADIMEAILKGDESHMETVGKRLEDAVNMV